jgi:hypothetical protein
MLRMIINYRCFIIICAGLRLNWNGEVSAFFRQTLLHELENFNQIGWNGGFDELRWSGFDQLGV